MKNPKPHYLTYGIDARESSRRYYRRQRREFILACFQSILALALIVGCVFAVAKFLSSGSERDERASYLEGYYNIDKATALALADSGMGKSAREVLNLGNGEWGIGNRE